MYPPRDPELLLGHRLAHAFGRVPDQSFLGGRERPRLIREVLNGRRVAIRANQSRQRLYQMPGRAIDARFIARMNVPLRPASPALAARNQLQLDHALGPQVDGDGAIQRLRSHWHEYAVTFAQRDQHIWTLDDLREVRRSDLLFTLRDKNE